jgi:flagellar hook assembly protein FlgD
LYSRPITVHVSPGVGVSGREGTIPEKFALLQNYPNPFNPETKIEYHLPCPSEVRLMIYDIRGQLVRELIQGEKPAGYHEVIWDSRNSAGQNVAAGIYIYKIEMRGKEANG